MMQFVTLVVLLIVTGSSTVGARNDHFFIDKEGDLILGGLFPIHLRGSNENDCGKFQEMTGYHYLQAMLYAIDKINNDTTILPNITLGTRIYDSCNSQTIGARMTKEFIKMTLYPPENGAQLVGVIGPQSSDLCKVIADFLRVFHIPLISYGATASDLSDKSIYSYFFRTVPPDTWQVGAMVDVIKKLNWSYVITINSEGLYGKKGVENFLTTAKQRGICIAESHRLPAFPADDAFDQLVLKLKKEQMARVVVLFTSQEDTTSILKALEKNPPLERFYWMGSDAWGKNPTVVERFEAWAEGAITLSQLDEPVPGFSDYFKNVNEYKHSLRNNSWFMEFWQTHFRCSFDNTTSTSCSGNESLTDREIDYAPIRTVVNAVYAMAHALHRYVKDRCPKGSGLCQAVEVIKREKLIDYLKNTTFRDQATGEIISFDSKQEISGSYSIFNFQRATKKNPRYSYRQVGVWKGTSNGSGELNLNTSKLFWPGNGSVPPASVCSESCALGYMRERKDGHDLVCCWTCSECGPRDTIVNNTCAMCGYGYVPDETLSKCMKLAVLDVLKEPSSKGFISVAMFGLLAVLIVAAIFFKHGGNALIKASSRELSGIILFGLALLFTCPILLLVKPTHIVCICQPFVLGLALALCYAPLFMKILRIYRIFSGARKSVRKPMLVSSTSQVLIALGLILIQLLFSAISFFPTPPAPIERETASGDYLLLECSIGKNAFASLLSYNMLLMALCTVMAFKTRRFPRNFNEAKYIGFTMYFTCFVWIIFFPSYLSSASGLRRINWECGAILFIGWITLLGLFGPKMYVLFLGSRVSTADQLAMTNNTMSQAAVVQVGQQQVSILENQIRPAKVNSIEKEDSSHIGQASST